MRQKDKKDFFFLWCLPRAPRDLAPPIQESPATGKGGGGSGEEMAGNFKEAGGRLIAPSHEF